MDKIRVHVVGVPEDGCLSLTSRAVNVVATARVVAGHPRHREWFPQFKGSFLDMSQVFSGWLAQVLEESEEGGVVVLASGDPLFFGIGTTLLKKLPADELAFIPTQSSAQLAFARLGLPWQEAGFLSCHGRERSGLVSRMQQGELFAILTDAKNSPQQIAAYLMEYNQPDWRLTVCEQLGATDERISAFSVAELAQRTESFAGLNILVAQRQSDALWGGHGQFAADSAFEKRMPKQGLITKQAVRHLALTSLSPNRTDVVWDIGAGSGSIAIEAAKFAWQGKVYALECNPDCYSAVEANIRAHSTDNVTLVRSKAPDGLAELPAPDAVFVGGSRGNMDAILATAWQALNENGRLVVSAVTMDTVVEVYNWAKSRELEFDARLINVSSTQPLAHYLRYQAENPIHLFSVTKNTHPAGEQHEQQ
jgi:precorrin-6Y C5,15-methyltransferase (decarboxylating)